MKEYIATIIYICIFSIILELILPDNKMKKYIATLVSLLVILTIISPVFNFLKNENVKEVLSNSIEEITSKHKTDASYDFASYKDKMVTNSTKEKIEQEILSNLRSKFQKLDITKVIIKLDEKYSLETVDVYLTKLSSVDTAKDIICHIVETYNVKDEIINVIKGE